MDTPTLYAVTLYNNPALDKDLPAIPTPSHVNNFVLWRSDTFSSTKNKSNEERLLEAGLDCVIHLENNFRDNPVMRLLSKRIMKEIDVLLELLKKGKTFSEVVFTLANDPTLTAYPRYVEINIPKSQVTMQLRLTDTHLRIHGEEGMRMCCVVKDEFKFTNSNKVFLADKYYNSFLTRLFGSTDKPHKQGDFTYQYYLGSWWYWFTKSDVQTRKEE